jgi:hypothetical protein
MQKKANLVIETENLPDTPFTKQHMMAAHSKNPS